MAGISITGQMKVATLQKAFKEEFGLSLRIYDGRSFADSSKTLSQVRKKKGTGKALAVARNMKVGNLEAKFEEEFGLKVQVSGSDDSYLCDNENTLNTAQQEDERKIARKENKKMRLESSTAETSEQAQSANEPQDYPEMSFDGLEDFVTSLYEVEQEEDGEKVATFFPFFKQNARSWFSIDNLPDLYNCVYMFKRYDTVSDNEIQKVSGDLLSVFEAFIEKQKITDIDHYTANNYFLLLLEEGIDSKPKLDAAFEILIASCTHENSDRFDISHVFSDLDSKTSQFPILAEYYERVCQQFAPLILKLNDEARRPFVTDEQAEKLNQYL